MIRPLLALSALLLAATPALAQTPAASPAPAATPAPAQANTPPKDVPMARLISDGAQVRGADSKDRIILQLGKFVFTCKQNEDKPTTCDLIP